MALPETLTSGTLADPAKVMSDLNYLDAKSDNITEINTPNAKFPNSNLANPNVEELVNLTFTLGAALTTGIKCHADIQGTGAYTIVGARYSFNMSGGTAGAGNTFQILAGAFNGTTFTTTNTVVNSTSFYTAAGNVANSADATLVTTAQTGPITFALNINAISGTPPTSGTFSVTLRIKRALQN